MNQTATTEDTLTKREFLTSLDRLATEIRLMRRQNERKPSKFISRGEVIKDVGIQEYSRAIECKELTPIKFGDARNCKVRILTEEYNRYINNLLKQIS